MSEDRAALKARIEKLQIQLAIAERALAEWGNNDVAVPMSARYDVARLGWKIVVQLPNGEEGFIHLVER